MKIAFTPDGWRPLLKRLPGSKHDEMARLGAAHGAIGKPRSNVTSRPPFFTARPRRYTSVI